MCKKGVDESSLEQSRTLHNIFKSLFDHFLGRYKWFSCNESFQLNERIVFSSVNSITVEFLVLTVKGIIDNDNYYIITSVCYNNY